MNLRCPHAREQVTVLAALLLSLHASRAAVAKPPLPTPPDTPVMGELDPYLLDTLYKSDDPDLGLAAIANEPRFQQLVKKHDLKLFGGPILGSVTDSSARFWVRTPGAARVQVVVSDQAIAATETGPDRDFTAVLQVDGLQPATAYKYNVLVNGQPVYTERLPEFRTSPPAGQAVRFSVAFGGCARYNPPKERIWDVIASRSPAALLLLGDNVYIDHPESRTKQRVHYYRRQLRKEYQRLTSSTATYAIYDDHDLGGDDCVGGPDPFKPAWKHQAWKVFRENWNNPSYGGEEQQPGCWFRFAIGDVEVFMLDNRYYRAFDQHTMLGPAQKQWLLDALANSTATFKVLASGTLWTELADKGGRDSWEGVKEEREELFSFIDRNQIGGVILISADRHRTDVYKIARPNGYDLYEFENAKLTNDHTHPTKPDAVFSYNDGNFYGLLDFDLTKEDPQVTYRCITIDDKEVYSLPLKRSQLQSK